MNTNLKGLLRVLGVVVLALAWLVPNHYPPWGVFYTESGAAIGLALLVCAQLLSQRPTTVANVATWIAIVAILPLMQWSAGQLVYVGDAWMSTLYILALALAIGVGSAQGDAETNLSIALAWACLAGSLASSALAMGQAAQAEFGIWMMDAEPGMRPYANLAQPNNLASLIGFGFASLFLLFERRRVGVWSSVSMLGLLLFGVSVTQSRTALLYGPFALLAMVLWSRRALVMRTRLGAVVAIIALHWTFTAAWPSLQTTMLLAPSTSLGQREASSIRFLVWPVLLDALSTRPWLGFGWLQVGAAELSAVDRHPISKELWLQAHNIVLDLSIFCGYPFGLLLSAALLIWFFNRMWRVRNAEAAAGMLVVGILGIHAMLELPHQYAYFLIPAGLWAGIVERELQAKATVSARWLWPAALAACAGTLTVWIDYPRIEEEFRLVRFEGAHIRTASANAEPLPSNPALSSLTAFLEQARTRPMAGMTEAQLRAMRQSVERYPYAASLLRYGEALSLNDRPNEAREATLKIRYIFGNAVYRQYRAELRNEVIGGRPELIPLEQSLPD